MSQAPRTSLLLAVVLTFGGCTARGQAPRHAAAIARADALVRDGCYRCLAEALEIYERASADRRPSGSAIGVQRRALLPPPRP